MILKITSIAAALTVAATLSAWAGCAGHGQQAMSCADGTVWDHETRTCVPLQSS